jgi:O-antigen/teichoic acid export membrane protein
MSLFEMFFTLITQILNAKYDTKLLGFASLASHVVYIGLLLVALPLGWGVLGVVGAAAGGNLVACVILLGRVVGGFNAVDPDDSGSRIESGRLVRFSLPFAFIGFLNFLVWRQSETMFLAHFRSASETGFFDLAYRVPQTVLEFVPGTVWPLVMAGISEVYSRNADNIRLAIDRYYRMLFLLCAPISIAGIVLSGKMVPILFGEAMSPAAVPTQLFFAIFTLSFFGTPLSMALYVIEKPHVNLIIYICLAVINVALDLALIPKYGVAGAIAPVGVVIFLSPLIYRAVLGRYVEGIRIPLRFIGKCFLASSVVLILIPFLGFVNGVFELVVAVLAAVGLVILAFKAVRVLGEEELSMLGAVPVPMANKLLKFLSS